MLIAALIISCLTLIVLAIFFYLSQKSLKKIYYIIDDFKSENKLSSDNLKKDLLSKVSEFETETILKIDKLDAEFKTIITNNTSILNDVIIRITKEIKTDNHDEVTAAKSEILELLFSKFKDFIGEFSTTITNLKNSIERDIETSSSKINNELNSVSQIQTNKYAELVNEVNVKYNKIIDEIKNPLTLD